MAGLLFTSGLLLVYTALVVPIQMLLWDYSNQCKMFPTLYIDMIVDCFFLVELNITGFYLLDVHGKLTLGSVYSSWWCAV
jgi:hypothetical protein